jgi:phenylpropionate dioxygenase-like ring-hydroxylating dioxygenase large terminal subunit
MTREDNELLTRVANGAPMGRFLRENYWFPAALSSTLIAGGAPVRVQLLGDKFVTFRSHDSRIGFFNEACPHRRTSLALARNEDNALRCIYHGWKFGVDGTVLETPTQPHDRESFCKRVPLHRYSVREAAGLVWVFLGQTAPRFPDFVFMKASGAHVATTRKIVKYNWVQSLDGLADSAHIGILHQDFIKKVPGNDAVAAASADSAPTYEFLDRPAGFRFAAVRKMGKDQRYLRISEFIAPWYSFIAYEQGYVHASVPIDDETTAFYLIQYNLSAPVKVEATPLDDPTDWPPYPDLGPDQAWGQDREAMARGAFSGFAIHAADIAVAESQGGITDRSQEFLTDSDRALIRLRSLLIDSAKEFQRGSVPRIARHDAAAYSQAWVGDRIVSGEQDWRG